MDRSNIPLGLRLLTQISKSPMLPVLVEASSGTIRSGRRGARRRALDIYQGRFEVTAQNTSTITRFVTWKSERRTVLTVENQSTIKDLLQEYSLVMRRMFWSSR